jgi:hypothetical protein
MVVAVVVMMLMMLLAVVVVVVVRVVVRAAVVVTLLSMLIPMMMAVVVVVVVMVIMSMASVVEENAAVNLVASRIGQAEPGKPLAAHSTNVATARALVTTLDVQQDLAYTWMLARHSFDWSIRQPGVAHPRVADAMLPSACAREKP